MAHPLLFNPFHSRPEPTPERAQEQMEGRAEEADTQPARRLARSTPVCSHCRSDDIVSQASVQWSNEKQEWELASTFAQPVHCKACNRPCDIVWLPLN